MTTLCLCLDCKRFIGVKERELTCELYPKGIPEDIYFDLEEGQECKEGYHYEKKE